MRASLVVSIVASIVAFSASTGAQAAIRRATAISPQPLVFALRTLVKERQFQIIYSSELLADQKTEGAVGELTMDEALTQLLRGTGLAYQYLDDKTVAIVPTPTGPAQQGAVSQSVGKRSASGGDAGSSKHRDRSIADPLQTTTSARNWRVAAAQAAPQESAPADSNPNDPRDLEEIIVTATKRAESLQDAPLAVSAISAADIQARGLTQFADYLNGVPGVFFEDAGPGRSMIRMRGIVASEEGGMAAAVATYFGETVTSVMNIAGAKPNPRLVDISRVEVLRGPQGTLYGANSLSGVVRVIPTAPNLQEFEVNLGTRGFTTAHSDDESYHVEGVVNIPLIQDRLALRLVAFKDDIAGYIDNVVPVQDEVELIPGAVVIPGNPAFTRKDVNSEDTWGARAALSWQATEQLKFDLTYLRQDVKVNGESTVRQGVGDYETQRAIEFLNSGLFNTEDLDVGTFVVNYNWNDVVALTSASSYTKMQHDSQTDYTDIVVDNVGLPLPWLNQGHQEGEVFTQEVRLQSTGDAPLQWLAGLFYMDQQFDTTQIASDLSCPTCITQFIFGQDFGLRTVPGQSRFLNQKQRSVFGDVSYRFAPRWTAGVGARYLEDEIERRNIQLEGLAVGGGPTALEPPANGTSYELNPSAYLRFEPNEDMTLYAQAGRGFRSGTANSALLLGDPDCSDERAALGIRPLAAPDTLWNYELGMKSQFVDGRLGINAAVFKQKWKGVQIDTDTGCGFDGTVNGGDIDGEGAELEMTARLSNAWRINLSAAYSHNEFETVNAGFPFAPGDTLPGAPERNFGAGVQYDFAISGNWAGFARADYTRVGSMHYVFGQTNPRSVAVDSYGVANVRVGAQRDNLSVDLFGRNLTDKRGVVAVTDPDLGFAQLGGARENIIRPREVGVEVRYSFR